MVHFFKAIAMASIIAFPSLSFAQANTPYNELPAGTYEIDPTHASITWKVSHLGLSDYTARFTKFTADLDYNPADPTQSSLNVKIDPTSIKTDYPYPEKKDFDAKLVSGEGWFNAGAFPTIEFKSSSIEKTSDNTGKLTGNLKFLGVTKPLTLDVTFNGAYAEHPFAKKPALGFSATGTLKRSEWGMNTYIPNIGDEVKLLIEAEFTKADAVDPAVPTKDE